MSTSEDCELQDLVKQTLERTGSLSKIRAELRAGIFLALEENACFQGTNVKNPELQNFAQDIDGDLVICLVKELLECFGLSFTASVLDPELASHSVHCSWKTRTELMKQLDLSPDLDKDNKKPLLYHVLRRFRDQHRGTPSRSTKISKNQKENTPLFGSSASPVALFDQPLKPDVTYSNLDEEREPVQTVSSRMSSKTDNVEWKGSIKPSTITEQDSFVPDLCKSNFSLLGDLPPLSPSTYVGKTNLSPSNKSAKQMSKLKSILLDSSQESTNTSNNTDDELASSVYNEEFSDSDNLDEKQIEELLDG